MNEILYIATSIAQFCIGMSSPQHCTNHMAACMPEQARIYPEYQIDGWLENCMESYVGPEVSEVEGG